MLQSSEEMPYASEKMPEMLNDREKIRKEVGQRIHDERLANYLTNQKLASYLEISESYLVKIQSGERMPSIELLQKMCCIFGRTADYMLTGKDNEADAENAMYYRKQQFGYLCSRLTPEQFDHIQGTIIAMTQSEHANIEDAISVLQEYVHKVSA